MDTVKRVYRNIGLPRIIIFLFFLATVITAIALKMNVLDLLGNILRRWGIWGILVLAMVPGIQCGIGPNFGVSLGIVCGLVGALISVEFGISNLPIFQDSWMGPWVGFFLAAAIGVVLSIIVGIAYGFLLNRVKGSEMTVSTYVGFSIIALMNILWLVLPFKNGTIIWPVGGQGARTTISLANDFSGVLSDAGAFVAAGSGGNELLVPTGMLLFFFLICAIVYLFMRSKTGTAMSAAGINPNFARANGINVDRMRILGTTVSTALGAVGIITYAQAFGFLQLYNAPLMMGFNCVAAVLIGGATTSRARISNVIIGTFMFQGILVIALPVANRLLAGSDLSDIMRMIISNGIILYALTKTKGGASDAE